MPDIPTTKNLLENKLEITLWLRCHKTIYSPGIGAGRIHGLQCEGNMDKKIHVDLVFISTICVRFLCQEVILLYG